MWTFVDFPGPDNTRYTIDTLKEKGILVQADSLSSLAESLGVPAESFQSTIQAFNQIPQSGDPWRGSSTEILPLNVPPYSAIQLGINVAKSFGGVAVDVSGRVQQSNGQILEGAWAAGELTGMIGGSISGQYGFTGSLSAVILSGRIAGAAAAEE